MKDKYRTNIPRFNVLTRDKLELIHLSTLEVLRRTGIVIRDPKAVEVFKKGGCTVEAEKVRIPSHLVEWTLRNRPHRIAMCDRNGAPAMFLEENNSYFGPGSDTPHIVDPYTQKRRRAVLKDIENVSKTVDYLDEISFVMCSGIASDVNSNISDIYHFEAMLNNTEKPIIFTAWNLENLKSIVHMAELVAGGEQNLKINPLIALYTQPISPLLFGQESAQKLMFMAEKSLPVVFNSAVIMGGTSPITIAGSIIQANAEMLAGHVLANLIQPGTPLIYGGGITPMDMSTSRMSYAAPELMLAKSAIIDLAKYYRLPIFGPSGCSDSPLYDQQAALEGSMWILLASLNRLNLVHDVGYIDNGLTTSLEQLVVSDEVIGMVRRICQGFELTEETMALDLIDRIGPGGEYLTSDHTLKHFKENWYPKLISRIPYEKWENEGGKDLGKRANEKVRHILENHSPKPLDENLKNEIRKIVQSKDI